MAAPALGPCRHCGHPSWLADNTGPVHECCDIAITKRFAPDERCPCFTKRTAP